MAENERDTDGIRTFGVAIHKKIVLFLCKSLCYWKVFAPTYGSKPLRINLGNEIVTSSFGVFLSFVFFLLEMNVAFRNTKVFQIWSCCNIEYTTAISSICVLLGVVVSISVFAYSFSEKRSCHMASGYIMMIKIKIINYMKKINFGLKKKIQKMEENMVTISNLYSSEDDEVSEERLFDYLLLHPTGYIDKKNVIMNSAVAEKYYRMGYITKGVGDDFRQQYRLTSFGLSQIELAMSLILLS